MLSRFVDVERLIHSTKTAIACIIGFLFTRLIGFKADQWIVITIIVVMCAQIYVGSVIGKAYLRFLGTLIGCLFAALVLMTFGLSYPVIIATIGIASFFFSYLATGQESLSYMGTLGAVTTTIIMLGDNPTLTFAAERFLEISVGIFIATLVSQFFLPINARTHLRRSQSATLKLLRDFYEKSMITEASENGIDIHEIDEAIVKILIKQRQLAKESVREPLGKTFDQAHFLQSLYAERDVLRAINFMHRAFTQIDRTETLFARSPVFTTFNDAVLKAFNTLSTAIASEKPTEDHLHIPPLKPLKDELEKVMTISTHEELIYVEGFLFSAEILVNSLTKLAQLFKVPIYPSSP